jgi:MoaA/NifB/PqqE/SkfB family radical SAM enzyme
MLKFCSAPWDTITVAGHGAVSSCMCSDWHTKKWGFGNLFQTSLIDLYGSNSFADMRSSVLDQSFQFCQKDQCHKLWNLDLVDNFDQVGQYPSLPTNINLAIDQNCNLKCASCRLETKYAKEVNPNAQIILTNILESYKDFDHKVRIYCDASGDIFASLAYQQFFRREDLPKNFEFCLQTNGNLVTKNMDILTKLKSQIDIVIVSFDAATDDTYKIIRGGKFDIVVEGVRQMVQLGLRVTTQFVVQRENYKEILDYVVLCKELGVRHIGLQLIDYWGHMTKKWWAFNRIDDNQEIDYDFLIPALLRLEQDPQVGLCGGLKNLIASRVGTL